MREFRLKAVLASFLLIVAGFLACPSPLPAAAADEPVTVRVGLYDNKPKLWRDEKGIAQGLFPDIINAVAGMEGWRIDYVYGTWDECLKRLEANEIDIMPDVAVSEERRLKYDFNEETAFISWGIFYTRPGFVLESLKDLEGKRIAVMTSGILYSGPLGLRNLLDSFGIKAEIVDVKVYGDVFDLLEKGEADAGVVNQAFGSVNERDHDVRRSGIVFFPTELKFAFTKNAPKNNYFIGRIDEDLRLMKADADSAYHQAMNRHLSGIVEEVEVFPRWFKYLISGLLLLAAIIAAYIFVLHAVRRRLQALVEARTADLKKEKKSFQSIFEGSNDPIVLLDVMRLVIVECNNAAWRTLGYDKKDFLIGKSPLDFSAPTQPDGRPAAEVMTEYVAEVLKKGKAYFDWTCRHVDGTDIFTTVMLTPLEWEGRMVIHIALRDITEQKIAEEKVRSLDRLKGRFVTVITHVTRTPLSRIKWSLESLDSGDFGELKEEGRALIRQALDSNSEILRVMTNMNLTFDIERGALTLERMPASLESLASSVLKFFKSLPECKDVVCNVDIPDKKIPAVDMDSEKIRHVIFDLMDNARRFMAEGKKEVSIRIEHRDGYARFSLADSGIGIPEAEQKHIFERFFRASNAMLQYPDGMGVGLHISKAIIEKHGGVMGFESEEGRGSTFWFELPLVE